MKANTACIAVVSKFFEGCKTANTVVNECWNKLVYTMTYGERQEWKVYFVRFQCRKTGLVFYKFGITTSKNVLHRFDTSFEGNEGWINFNVSCIGSFKVPGLHTKEEVEKIYESLFQNRFPKNIWLEKYLGHGNWNGLSGITEIVAFHDGKGEGDRSPRTNVTLYSYKEACNFFYHIKAYVESGEPLPIIAPKRRCSQAVSLTAEEVLGAELSK